MSNSFKIVGTLDDHVSSSLDKIRGKFDTLGKSEGGKAVLTGAGIGAGISTYKLLEKGISAVSDYARSAIQNASDLNETITKSQVVFGDAAGEIKKFGEGAAQNMGLSENAAIAAASTFGNLFRSLGTAPEKVAPMSESLVKLASDLASFNNIPIDEALQKLQSGIVGQAKPLRELGVAISEASVDTEALALGFKKVNGTFTEGEKVQARYSLIFKQTQTAQGDFARTSDGLANTQRILAAKLEDVSATIGTKLYPVAKAATDLAIVLADHLDLVAAALAGIASIIISRYIVSMVAATVATATADAAAAGGTVTFFGLAAAIAAAAGPFLLIGAVVAVAVLALSHLKEIGEAVGAVLKTVGDILGSIPGPWHQSVIQIDADAQRASDAAVAFSKGYQGMADDARESGRIAAQSSATIGLAASNAAIDFAKTQEGMAADARESNHSMLRDANTTAPAIADAIGQIGDASVAASTDVRRSSSDIIHSIENMRKTLVDDAQSAADAIWDPQIKAAQLAADKIDLADERRILSSKKSTSAEKAEAARRIADLEKSIFVETADLSTYGDKTDRIRKTQSELAVVNEKLKNKHLTEEQRNGLKNLQGSLIARLSDMTDQSRAWGENLAQSYGDGIASGAAYITAKAAIAVKGAASILRASSPPGPESPLHFIDVWGKRTIQAWADGVLAGGPAAELAVTTVASRAARATRAASLQTGRLSFAGLPGQAPGERYVPAGPIPIVLDGRKVADYTDERLYWRLAREVPAANR